ncbi:coiled-coil domain-containing protein-domain-containing protein [Chytridium lagenaria]|nr:coiled-coil domain-containing protein-domain-containing protein [Chytridium lagenaria]
MTSFKSDVAKKRVRNRRLLFIDMVLKGEKGNWMQEEDLKEFGDYFSDEVLKRKVPALFEFYIGRHVPENERRKAFNHSMSLVERMYHDIDECHHRDTLEVTAANMMDEDEDNEADDEEEEDIIDGGGLSASLPAMTLAHQATTAMDYGQDEDTEEFDSDDEEGKALAKARKEARKARMAELRAMAASTLPLNTVASTSSNRSPQVLRPPTNLHITPADRLALRTDFHRIVKERFLAGLDEDFDYVRVDSNEAFDDLGQMERDAEDAYFDDDEDAGWRLELSGAEERSRFGRSMITD